MTIALYVLAYLAVGVIAAVALRCWFRSAPDTPTAAKIADWSVIIWPITLIMIAIAVLMVVAEVLAEGKRK